MMRHLWGLYKRGSRNFCQGGPGPTARRHTGQGGLFFGFFFSPQLILQFTEGVQWFIAEKTILSQGSRGGPTFSRGGPLFPGDPKGKFYRDPYNFLIFQGAGVRTPIPHYVCTCYTL